MISSLVFRYILKSVSLYAILFFFLNDFGNSISFIFSYTFYNELVNTYRKVWWGINWKYTGSIYQIGDQWYFNNIWSSISEHAYLFSFIRFLLSIFPTIQYTVLIYNCLYFYLILTGLFVINDIFNVKFQLSIASI